MGLVLSVFLALSLEPGQSQVLVPRKPLFLSLPFFLDVRDWVYRSCKHGIAHPGQTWEMSLAGRQWIGLKDCAPVIRGRFLCFLPLSCKFLKGILPLISSLLLPANSERKVGLLWSSLSRHAHHSPSLSSSHSSLVAEDVIRPFPRMVPPPCSWTAHPTGDNLWKWVKVF